MTTADLTALFLTNEYPPSSTAARGSMWELTRALRERIGLDIRTFGDHDTMSGRLRVRGYPPATATSGAAEERMRGAWARCRATWPWPSTTVDADVVHCHTWYTHLGGL